MKSQSRSGPTEEYFPRGKSKTEDKGGGGSVTTKGTAVTPKEKRDGRMVALFGNKENNQKLVDKKKKKTKKDKKAKAKTTTTIFSVKSVPSLTYSRISEGMVLLGVVREVEEFQLKVSLPGHIQGTVPITAISQAYTAYLRKAAEQAEEEEEEEEDSQVAELSSMFKVGQPVIVAVTSCVQEGEKNHYRLSLSLEPKVVMAGRLPGVGELCVASIMSKEDHGYIMDVGSTSARGFLPNKVATKMANTPLTIGMVLACQVTKKEVGALTLSCLPGKIWNQVQSAPTVHNLLPGTGLQGKVEAHLDNGLKVGIGGGLSGYLHRDLFPTAEDSVKSFPVGSELHVRLEYMVPTLNTLLLTARSIWPIKDIFHSIAPGVVVEEATIAHVAAKHLILRLYVSDASIVYGYVTARQAKDGSVVVGDLREKFKEGEKVKAKVLALDHCSGVAVCTMQKSKLSATGSLDQLSIGQRVRAVVKQFVTGGLEVTVGHNISGFIPTLYLSDVVLKHPEKKFLPGDKVECRVLRINLERRRLHLTSKPILVKEEFTVVDSYETAKVGTVTEGVVAKISHDGLLINLWGDLRGFAPRSLLSTEPIEYPEKLFFIGQAVKCQVTECDEGRRRISLSLVIGTMKPLGRKQRQQSRLLRLGGMYSARVIAVTEKGLDVQVEEGGFTVQGCIPLHHLTDNASLAALLLPTYKVGDEVDALCFHRDVVTILSLKPSLILAAKDASNLPSSVDNLDIGQVLAGAVQAVRPYGAFVRPAWGLDRVTVLVPTRFLADFFIEAPEDVLDVGQTLFVRIKEVGEGDHKITGTASLKDIEPTPQNSVEVLESLLDDLQRIKAACSSFKDLKVGDLVTASVREVTEVGAVMDIGGLVGLCPASGLGQLSPKPDEALSAVVLFLDYQAGCLEVSCDPAVVALVALAREKPGLEAAVKGRVVLTRTEHSFQILCVSHPPRLAGNLVYVPTRAHYNDLVGQEDTAAHAQLSLISKAVTSRGEVVAVNEAQLRKKQKQHHQKRSRQDSLSDEGKCLLKRLRSESECSASGKLSAVAATTNLSSDSLEGDNTGTSQQDISSAVEGKEKRRSKKKRRKEAHAAAAAAAVAAAGQQQGHAAAIAIAAAADKQQEVKEESVETEEVKPLQQQHRDKSSSVKPGLVDPGWNLSLTSVSLPAWGRVSIWDNEDEAEEDDDKDSADDKATEDKKSKKRKHTSKAEAKALRRAEEEAAQREEEKRANSAAAVPQTAADFEQLVLASPNSSLVWVQYMAWQVQGCQYGAARAVAARAVERISFREEGERLNVYLAWLNLENAFGSPESLNKVLQEAVQRNDEYKVYCQMAAIYAQSNKTEEAEKMFRILVKKFPREKDVWIRFGMFYYKQSRLEDGRFTFTRALQSLDKRDVVETSVKFAQIEFKYGDVERGKTMFEKLVASYPRRTDLWSCYADQLVRTGDIAAARVLYIRMSTLGLQAKKMKPMFAKWLEFERVHGTEEQQNEVRRTALAFLHAKAGEGGEAMEVAE